MLSKYQVNDIINAEQSKVCCFVKLAKELPLGSKVLFCGSVFTNREGHKGLRFYADQPTCFGEYLGEGFEGQYLTIISIADEVLNWDYISNNPGLYQNASSYYADLYFYTVQYDGICVTILVSSAGYIERPCSDWHKDSYKRVENKTVKAVIQ